MMKTAYLAAGKTMPREVKWFEEGYTVSLSCKQKAKIDTTFLDTL